MSINPTVRQFLQEEMVEELMLDEGWTLPEAMDWIDFNTIRALPYSPSPKPLILYRLPEEVLNERRR